MSPTVRSDAQLLELRRTKNLFEFKAEYFGSQQRQQQHATPPPKGPPAMIDLRSSSEDSLPEDMAPEPEPEPEPGTPTPS